MEAEVAQAEREEKEGGEAAERAGMEAKAGMVVEEEASEVMGVAKAAVGMAEVAEV